MLILLAIIDRYGFLEEAYGWGMGESKELIFDFFISRLAVYDVLFRFTILVNLYSEINFVSKVDIF